MPTVELLRKDVTKYISNADVRVVKMVHAMLLADSKNDLWDELPKTVQSDVEEAINQSYKGEGIAHKEVMKKIKKWAIK